MKVWDLTATGQAGVHRTVRRHSQVWERHIPSRSVPDGRQLAAGNDGVVKVWDWKNRQLLHTFPGHEHAFDPAWRSAATGDAWRRRARAKAVKLWDAETGELLRTFPAHRHPVSALAFSPDGGRLASASFDRSVNVWDTTTGELLHTFDRIPETSRCVAFSPDGRRLASAGEDKTVRVWDATTGREVLGLRGHTDSVRMRGLQPGRPAPRLGQHRRDHPHLGRDPAPGGRGPGNSDLHRAQR